MYMGCCLGNCLGNIVFIFTVIPKGLREAETWRDLAF